MAWKSICWKGGIQVWFTVFGFGLLGLCNLGLGFQALKKWRLVCFHGRYLFSVPESSVEW